MRRMHRLGFIPVLVLTGCSSQYYTSQIREDGPSTEVAWASPTATDLRNRFEQPVQVRRDFVPRTLATADGVTPHWPLYLEDPFVYKGTGRSDGDPDGIAAGGRNKYHWGWVDVFALGYSPARMLLNTGGLPASLIVEHPFKEMESDGAVSKRFLWNEYDADYASPETHDRALNDLGPRVYADESAAVSNEPHNSVLQPRGALINPPNGSVSPAAPPQTAAPASPMKPVR